MARASLIFRYQWRAFWRRVLRTRRAEFYVPVLALLIWLTAVALPDALSSATRELAAGQTASMDRLLLVLCLLWLVVPNEDLHVSLSSDRLRRFPIDVRSLLALRLFSVFLSPIAWLGAIVSLLGLSPLLAAAHPLLGILVAVCFFALTLGVGGLGVAALGAVALAFALNANPATLVTTVAVATTPSAMTIPLATLLVSSAVVWYLLRWNCVRRVSGETSERTGRRTTRIARFPGRLGPLVQKEQRSIRSLPDLWIGLLLVVAAAALSVSASRSSTFRETSLVIVCVLNANVTLNCLGLERPAGLTRYLILPIRGKDLFLAKNVAVIIVVAAQMMLLLAIGAWQGGFVQLAAEIVVAVVLILAHLACGNIVSVFTPRRTEPRRFASAGDPVAALFSVLIASAPGVAVIELLRSDAHGRTLASAAIVLLTIAAYYSSLRYAGRIFERRIEIISRSLA